MFSSADRIYRPWLGKMIGLLSEFRLRMLAHGLFDLPMVIVLAIGLPVLFSVVSFFFGGTVHGWMLWTALGFSVVWAGMHSVSNMLKFVAVTSMAFAVAALVLAYSSWDSAVCHWSMMRAICEGWNPILGATEERLSAVVGGETCSLPHMLCAPKFPVMVAAVVVRATGLFSGIGFLFAMLFALCFLTGYRFLRQEAEASRIISAMSAYLLTLPLELMRQTLQGYVDYSRYAAVLVGLFSYFLWRRGNRLADLLLFLWGFVIAACSKSGALLLLIVALAVTTCLHWKSGAFRRALLVALALFLLFGFSPYVTEWIHNGSPFYPAHSFIDGQPTVDLCNDLISPRTRNPAALQMGWIARVVYAWVSQDLAIAGCRWWYSDPAFSPVFKTPTVNGLADGFAHWLWFCGIAFFFIRNWSVRIVCIVILLTILLLPTRYVGFYRYTPEISALPVLCLASLSRFPISRWNIDKAGRIVLLVVLGYMCLYSVFFALSWLGLQQGLEAARQREFDLLKAENTSYAIAPLNPKLRYVCSRRVVAAGLTCKVDRAQDVPRLYFAPPETFDLGLVPARDVKESRRRRMEIMREKPVFFSYYNSLFSPFTDFGRWRSYKFKLKDIPRVLRSEND